jgi:nickel/cobalt transporter (NicO) family protein
VSRVRTRRIALLAPCAIVIGLFAAAPAQAHPLGNFSINHLDSLRISADTITDIAIVDTAEIPTAQSAMTIDADHNGSASPSELQQYGSAQCEAYRAMLTLTVDGEPLTWSTKSTAFAYRTGQAGLQTTRLECRFEASSVLAAQHRVALTNAFQPDRVGWREIVAVGDGVRIVDSAVPATSITSGLTTYPLDLLSSPLDIRTLAFDVAPGGGVVSTAVQAKPSASIVSRATGPFAATVERVNGVFNNLVGRRQLTLSIGLLAIGLALVLGASHALLPGHGKTVMAAYIAGRQGSVRDAVLVGATVTATHTGGVLLLGLALTVSTSLAGESVLAWLGVVSGLMIAALGASLLRSATNRSAFGRHHHDHGGGHGHDHGHAHRHGLGHRHSNDAPPATARRHDHDALLGVGSGRQALVLAATTDGRQIPVRVNTSGQIEDFLNEPLTEPSVSTADNQFKTFSRRGLVGMGIAGGLVPSPSALVVLLSAIALGRTIFGVVLVIGYGIGMAGTLTLAGVLLVRVRDRYQHSEPGRLRLIAGRWTRLAPYFTAGLVFIVGLGLAIRSLGAT